MYLLFSFFPFLSFPFLSFSFLFFSFLLKKRPKVVSITCLYWKGIVERYQICFVDLYLSQVDIPSPTDVYCSR